MVSAQLSLISIDQELWIEEELWNQFFVIGKLPLAILETHVNAEEDVVWWSAYRIVLQTTEVAGVPPNQVVQDNARSGAKGGNLVSLLLFFSLVKVWRQFRLLLHGLIVL